MEEIECSLNMNIVGKPEKHEDKNLYVDGHRVNLGNDFMTCSLLLEEIWTAVTVDGFAIGPALIDGTHNRKIDTFKSHQLLFVDVDGGMTIEELLNDEIYNAYGTGFYTTPSHTEENHRFRIVFRLENPIHEEIEMRKLYCGGIKAFGGDKSCKDASRLYYGTPNCLIKELNVDKFLPHDIVEEFIKLGSEEVVTVIKPNKVDGYVKSDGDLYVEQHKILEMLKSIYIGDYEEWRRIGWGLCEGGYSLSDFEYVTIGGLMNKKDSKDCAKIWNSYDSSKGVTMGSVIHFLKENGKIVNKTKEEKQQGRVLNNLAALLNKHNKN